MYDKHTEKLVDCGYTCKRHLNKFRIQTSNEKSKNKLTIIRSRHINANNNAENTFSIIYSKMHLGFFSHKKINEKGAFDSRKRIVKIYSLQSFLKHKNK